MLERKKVIKNKDQIRQEDGKRILIYEHTKNGDVFTILDPALKLTELTHVQTKVAELLEHGLNPKSNYDDENGEIALETKEEASVTKVAAPQAVDT